jgi:hypothetical protein
MRNVFPSAPLRIAPGSEPGMPNADHEFVPIQSAQVEEISAIVLYVAG